MIREQNDFKNKLKDLKKVDGIVEEIQCENSNDTILILDSPPRDEEKTFPQKIVQKNTLRFIPRKVDEPAGIEGNDKQFGVIGN